MDGSGNVYVADPNNDAVEKVTPSGVLSVFAGRRVTAPTTCTALSPCVATQVSLFEADEVAVDNAGNVYIADFADHLVEKVTPAGSLSVLAGTGASGAPSPGPATARERRHPLNPGHRRNDEGHDDGLPHVVPYHEPRPRKPGRGPLRLSATVSVNVR